MGETLEPVIDGLGLENPQVVQLNGSPTDNNATLFREGYFGIAEPRYDAGDWTLVDDQAVPDWDNQQALVIFEQILTAAGGEVDAAILALSGLRRIGRRDAKLNLLGDGNVCQCCHQHQHGGIPGMRQSFHW